MSSSQPASRISLIEAARNGGLTVVAQRMNEYADVNQRGENGTTALHAACSRGHAPIVELLLNSGADVNARTNAQYTPLMAASRGRILEILTLLIERGAHVNAADENGHTALMCLLSDTGGDADECAKCVELLLRSGALINAKSKAGATALLKAVWFFVNDIIPVLLAHGADASLVDNDGSTALDLAKRRGNTRAVQLLTCPKT